MSTPTTPPFESRYPELSLPPGGWKSTLPEHLLIGADEQTAFIMHELSKNTQATEFACRAVLEQNAHLRSLNGKVYRNEQTIGEAQTELNALKDQASVVTPFIKPLSMFATLWEWTIFKWVFIGGIVFFLGVLYPYFLHSSFVTWLNTFLGVQSP